MADPELILGKCIRMRAYGKEDFVRVNINSITIIISKCLVLRHDQCETRLPQYIK